MKIYNEFKPERVTNAYEAVIRSVGNKEETVGCTPWRN